jgi:hypothetical protein
MWKRRAASISGRPAKTAAPDFYAIRRAKKSNVLYPFITEKNAGLLE